MKNVLIAGCGKLGLKLAAKEQAAGNKVYGLCQSEASQQKLNNVGIIALRYDLDLDLDSKKSNALESSFFNNIDYLYYFIPPQSTGVNDQRLNNFLAQLSLSQMTISECGLLISTTGVYGDCQGGWVDESHRVAPETPRALRRYDAEQQFSKWMANANINSLILRVPGIYSADRLPLRRLKNKTPILDPQIAPFSNRIHENDLVEIVYLSSRLKKTLLLNIADDQPSTMSDYFLAVAAKYGIESPPLLSMSEAEAQLGKDMLTYLKESRRIDNSKMKQVLAYQLKYPDLEAGLLQCIEESKRKKS